MRKTALFATIVAATLVGGSAAYAGDLHITVPDPGRLLTRILYHHVEPSRHYQRAPRYRYSRHWRHERREYWRRDVDHRRHGGWGDRRRGSEMAPRHHRRDR